MRIKLTLFLVLCASYCIAQTDSISAKTDTVKTPTIDERLESIEQRLEVVDIDLSLKNRYKLYKTENVYNLLKLDTKTGKIWQVQWHLDDLNKEGTWIINDKDLSYGWGYGSNNTSLFFN